MKNKAFDFEIEIWGKIGELNVEPEGKVKGYTSEEIKKLVEGLADGCKGEDDFKVFRKLYLIFLVSKGYNLKMIAKIADTSYSQVYKWIKSFEEGGIDALKDGQGGKTSKLTNEEKSEIKSVLAHKKPKDLGYEDTKWTYCTISSYIKEKYNIVYSQSSILNIIKEFGYKNITTLNFSKN